MSIADSSQRVLTVLCWQTLDMFMDEIDYVRLNALTSLCKIGNRAPLVFDTEQLQIALGVLEDADRDVRESTHRMLQYDICLTFNPLNLVFGHLREYSSKGFYRFQIIEWSLCQQRTE